MNDPASPSSPPLPSPEADGVRAVLLLDRARILDACTRCGKCFEACPMAAYDDSLRSTDPAAVVDGVLDVLREQAGSPAALAWLRLCSKTGVCDAHCPAGISPKMMMRIARITALGGLGHPPQIPVKEDPDYFNKIHAFARLQLSAAEQREWFVAPRDPRGSK